MPSSRPLVAYGEGAPHSNQGSTTVSYLDLSIHSMADQGIEKETSELDTKDKDYY